MSTFEERLRERFIRSMKQTEKRKRKPKIGYHGKLVHFSIEETTYSGFKAWYCTEGYWLSDGLMMTKGGTKVENFIKASVHLAEECPA